MLTGSEGKPDAPTGLTISNLAPTGFKLDWDEPGDNGSPITGYKYEILDVSADPDAVVESGSVTGRSFSYYSLTPESDYRVRVLAVNDNGDGVWSSYTDQTMPEDLGCRSSQGSDTLPVDENTTAVGTVTASDDDFGAQVTGYRLNGGADQARFSITNAGVLTFNDAPDFEMAADAEHRQPTMW